MNTASFASPFGGDAGATADWFAARAVDMTTEKIRELEGQRGAGSPRVASPDGYRSAWRPELGVANLALRGPIDQPRLAAARAQLEILEYTALLRDTIELEIECPFKFRAFGRQFDEGRLVIAGDQTGATVTESNGGSVVFQPVCHAGKATWVTSTDQLLAPTDWFGVFITTDKSWYNYWIDQAFIDQGTGDLRAFRGVMCTLLKVIENYAPEYKQWISMLVNEISPLPGLGAKGSNSNSFISFPGHIHLSVPYSVSSGIVTLVHESSHQYFQLLQWHTDFVTDDSVEVYSILKNRRRPLVKLLLGYHAFVNALAALRLVSDRGFMEADLSRNLLHTEELVRGLQEGIEGEGLPYLTPLGTRFYASLREISKELLPAT
jgi:HEXXH motif-containing protein